jgi:twinkle protein
LTWIETCWDWLQNFSKIILFGDNDEAGQKMIKNIIVRLGEDKCYIAEHECKDANELLYRNGAEAVRAAVENAKLPKVEGLLNLADVVPYDVSRVDRVKSNIKWLDGAIGGFLMGELSVWTGKRGEGKSTFLGQLLIESVEQNYNVCAYSGELRADRFQYWIHLQMAGKEHIKHYADAVRQRNVAFVDKRTAERMKAWYSGKFWLYDSSNTSDNAESKGILKIFEYAVKRYGCKVFLVDNLMTSKFDISNDQNYYRAQSNFVGELVNFAKTYNVHIHLVAHPKKTKENLGNDEISGTGDITNRADNVFAIERNTGEENLDAVLKVMKNRSDGCMNEKIGMLFDEDSKRFYLESDKTMLLRKYGWNNDNKDWREIDKPIDCPF